MSLDTQSCLALDKNNKSPLSAPCEGGGGGVDPYRCPDATDVNIDTLFSTTKVTVWISVNRLYRGIEINVGHYFLYPNQFHFYFLLLTYLKF